MFPSALLFPLPDIELDNLRIEETAVTLVATSTQHAAICPQCQFISARIHSRYTRTIADLPCVGQRLILLRVRRFFCDAAACPQQTFAERFGTALPVYARRTACLADALRTIAFAAGGAGGARLAHVLAMPTSPRTLLRAMHGLHMPDQAAPTIIGLDEWAWKKGRSYGTICVDLERHAPIDLLPDRAPDTVAAWLAAHPSIQVIARDRSGGYKDAATRGAPQARQVADRWHLLKNLGEALEYVFHQHAAALKQAGHDLAMDDAETATALRPVPPIAGTMNQRRVTVASEAQHAEVVERYEQIHALRAKRIDIANIARQVGVSRQTVYRMLRLPEPPPPAIIHVARPYVIELYKPYVLQRWNEGCRNALQIWRELRDEHGYPYASRTVSRFVGELRKDSGVPGSFRSATAAPIYTAKQECKRPLSALQAARLVTSQHEQRSPWEVSYFAKVCELDPVVAKASTLAHQFVMMVRDREAMALDAWLAAVEASEIRELRTFATGLQRDGDAVRAALTLPYSNGQTEGQIQRLKLVKRSMCGQAGFDLLRKRVLYREQPIPIQRRKPVTVDMAA